MADPARARQTIESDPQWYRDAIIYQIHVRAYADSNADGIGDFRGLTTKLDYLRDLGVNTIWVLPFYPSPLKDDGYDIADYSGLHPDYGTLADFRQFLREAHRRGLRVITELVVNHTSDQHPWFQRARRSAAGSRIRDYYVWSDSSERYKDTRIIFKDFETSNWSWDPVARAYYWHRFYHHQPDLNYDNPEVRKAVYQTMEFWLGMGVDGMRLDAVPYLCEREGTNCENLPETHAVLKELRQRVDAKFRDRMLLAEANQWPEDAVAYFGQGDECHMAFHFPLMPRMFMSLRMEDRYPLVDILNQTPSIPGGCQWAVFLRNHDELTLEMVTDEERDYMYRVYANDPRARINLGIRRRLAPLVQNDRRRIELLNGLLFSLPGTPVIYYGDELGMGDNIYLGDRNGVRTPMQWSSDRNAGFSRANSQRLFLPVIIDPDFHYETINVETQMANPASLLWWMRRLIATRRRFKAFGRGTIEFLYPENRKILAFVREHENERILVVANLSRHAQYVELDLARYRGMNPVEISGNTRFPRIGDLSYLLTLGPHAFHWFSVEEAPAEELQLAAAAASSPAPLLKARRSWDEIFRREQREQLERALPRYLRGRRWFAGKARHIETASLMDVIPIGEPSLGARVALVRVDYTDADSETYMVPLVYLEGVRAQAVQSDHPQEIVARVATGRGEGILTGALTETAVLMELLEAITRRRRFKGLEGEILASPTRAVKEILGPDPAALAPSPLRAEQSNSSILYGQRAILKLFRRVDHGVNPDLEIGTFLTEKASFPNAPHVGGSLEYRAGRGEPMTLGILQGFVPNEGDAWRYTLDVLERYYERLASTSVAEEPAMPPRRSFGRAGESIPPEVRERIGVYLESAILLGRRTADLHLALASEQIDAAFLPEAFTPFHQRSMYQSMRNQTETVLQLLRTRLKTLSDEHRPMAEQVLGLGKQVLGRVQGLLDRRITARRTRVHGDYHLGQVLYTGKDFIIIDFEGEPSHSLSVRRLKRSPLRDVAGMLRSFEYASFAALNAAFAGGHARPEDRGLLERQALYWTAWVCEAYLGAYAKAAEAGTFLPKERDEFVMLLEVYLLEKALYELGYELNSRPDWVGLPLRGILRLVSDVE